VGGGADGFGGFNVSATLGGLEGLSLRAGNEATKARIGSARVKRLLLRLGNERHESGAFACEDFEGVGARGDLGEAAERGFEIKRIDGRRRGLSLDERLGGRNHRTLIPALNLEGLSLKLHGFCSATKERLSRFSSSTAYRSAAESSNLLGIVVGPSKKPEDFSLLGSLAASERSSELPAFLTPEEPHVRDELLEPHAEVQALEESFVEGGDGRH
jgi:hypothetical protein